jgi:hypothetical protein
MPTVRGKFIPEREKTRAVKRSFDVLLWIESLDRLDVIYLQNMEQLRAYLRAQYQGVCQIRFLVPNIFAGAQEALQRNGIPFDIATATEDDDTFRRDHPDLSDGTISRAALCAKRVGADCLVVSKGSEALSFAEDFERSIRCLVTDASFLLILTEIYVRGFDIPWTYQLMMWNGTWDTFYLHAEPRLFDPLMNLIGAAQRAECDPEVAEAARSIALNRMPQVCYTRDKLQWLSLQRNAARRDGFTNQTYAFETSYHLNFYYLLLSGTFDHLALLVNGVYALGLAEKQVGATYKQFLEALQIRSATMYSLFTSVEIIDFIARLGALRNLAAHRGSITPRKVVEKPDRQPTTEEIDQYLLETGDGWIIDEPYRSMSPQLVAMARSNATAEILEKNTIAEDVELVEYNGKQGFISPVVDTPWNFAMVRTFTLAVVRECSSHLASRSAKPATP